MTIVIICFAVFVALNFAVSRTQYYRAIKKMRTAKRREAHPKVIKMLEDRANAEAELFGQKLGLWEANK